MLLAIWRFVIPVFLSLVAGFATRNLGGPEGRFVLFPVGALRFPWLGGWGGAPAPVLPFLAVAVAATNQGGMLKLSMCFPVRSLPDSQNPVLSPPLGAWGPWGGGVCGCGGLPLLSYPVCV